MIISPPVNSISAETEKHRNPYKADCGAFFAEIRTHQKMWTLYYSGYHKSCLMSAWYIFRRLLIYCNDDVDIREGNIYAVAQFQQ